MKGLEIALPAEPIFHIGIFEVTNTLLVSWMAVAILIIGAVIFKKNLKKIPRGFQNVIEFILESLFNMIDGITKDRKQTYQFFPWVVTIFLFIMLSNWIGILPGFGSIGFNEVHEGKEVFVPLFRSANSDINMTMAIAIISVILTQVFGIAAIGVFKYAKKYINFGGPLKFILGLLELVLEVAKIFSFSFRLFGNVFAGEVLLMTMTFLVYVILPVPFYGLELFVGFIQALVFSMLSLIFFKVATIENH